MKTIHDNLVFVNSFRRYQSFSNSLMAATKTIHVPHLGGIEAGYALSNDSYDDSKRTCVLINSMCTTVTLYRDQFSDKSLTAAMNLLAIEPLGHGATSCSSEHFTYWDTAIMVLQIWRSWVSTRYFPWELARADGWWSGWPCWPQRGYVLGGG